MENQQFNANSTKPDTRKILWLAFTSAIIVYNIVAVLIAQSQKDFKGFVVPNDGLMPLLFYALLLASLINFIASFRLKEKIAIELLPGKKQSLTVASYAVSEMIAIYGLILFLIAGDFNHLYLFSGMSLAAMLLVYPRQ